MSDMLVKLYNLPLDFSFIAEQAKAGVVIRKPIGPEKHLAIDWIGQHFSDAWASEFDMSMTAFPPTCWIATQTKQLVGFACFDATGLGFFGPTGVHPDKRGRGIGKALLLACLLEMKLKGYGYAVIGSVGPAAFYEKCCGAVAIPDSAPSVWYDMLRRDDPPPPAPRRPT
jgi:GNAT superfamily N-acetyltransferase